MFSQKKKWEKCRFFLFTFYGTVHHCKLLLEKTDAWNSWNKTDGGATAGKFVFLRVRVKFENINKVRPPFPGKTGKNPAVKPQKLDFSRKLFKIKNKLSSPYNIQWQK